MPQKKASEKITISILGLKKRKKGTWDQKATMLIAALRLNQILANKPLTLGLSGGSFKVWIYSLSS